MKTKSEKLLLICVGIILISFITNSLHAQNKRLDDIVFFNHYYDINSSSRTGDITLYYVTNVDDTRKINTIQAYDLTMLSKFSYEHIYNFYKVVEVHVSVLAEDLAGKTYTKGTVYFDDNSKSEVVFGVINVNEGESFQLASMYMSSSSNTGDCQVAYDFNEPLTIKNIGTNLQDRVDKMNILVETELSKHELEKRIEDVSVYRKLSDITYPIPVTEYIKFSTQFTNQDINIYNIVLQVEFEEVEERLYVYNIHSSPVLTQKTIEQLLESRGL